MLIRFKSNQELECLGVHGSNILYQGVNRDALTFLFPADTNVQDLLDIFTPENCEQIWLIQEDSQDLHENYTIRTNAGIGMQNTILHYGDNNTTEVCWVTMAQSTVTERQIMQLNALFANR